MNFNCTCCGRSVYYRHTGPSTIVCVCGKKFTKEVHVTIKEKDE